jgi:hypothetical protein
LAVEFSTRLFSNCQRYSPTVEYLLNSGTNAPIVVGISPQARRQEELEKHCWVALVMHGGIKIYTGSPGAALNYVEAGSFSG